jgi:hypothetical protein
MAKFEEKTRIDMVTFAFDENGQIRGANVQKITEVYRDGVRISAAHDLAGFDPAEIENVIPTVAKLAEAGLALAEMRGQLEGLASELQTAKIKEEVSAKKVSEQTDVIEAVTAKVLRMETEAAEEKLKLRVEMGRSKDLEARLAKVKA